MREKRFIFLKAFASICIPVALLTAADAFASRARLAVLGTGDPLNILSAGSFYYDDEFNILNNPSYANDMRNFVHFERSNLARVGGANTADGGFVAGVQDFSVGAYVNYLGDIRGQYSVASQMRPIELILAGNTGVKWGLIAQFANWEGGSDRSASEINLKGGMQIGGLEPFLNITLTGSDKLTAGAETNYQDLTLGMRYRWGDWTPYVAYRQDSVGGGDRKTQKFGLGVGRGIKPAESTTLRYSVGFFRQTDWSIGSRTVVPAELSLESELASWVVGRVGLGYSLFDRTSGISNADRTTVAMGATFKTGKLALDFAAGGGDFIGANGDIYSYSIDLAHGLFAMASLNYHW